VAGLFAKARQNGGRSGFPEDLASGPAAGRPSTFQGQARTLAGNTTEARPATAGAPHPASQGGPRPPVPPPWCRAA
jgi:hypothetical protein